MTIASRVRPTLDGILAPWAAMIIAVLCAIVGTIPAIAENIRRPLAGAWRLLPQGRTAARGVAAGSCPMMSKQGVLQPSPNASHALTRKGSAEFGQAVTNLANSMTITKADAERVPT